MNTEFLKDKKVLLAIALAGAALYFYFKGAKGTEFPMKKVRAA